WDDANGKYVADCELRNNAANGECGPVSSSTFGTPVFTSRYDPGIVKGFGVRPYDWQGLVQVQHELGKGVGLTAGYFRTWYGNLTVTQNAALTPADFDSYCITAPV